MRVPRVDPDYHSTPVASVVNRLVAFRFLYFFHDRGTASRTPCHVFTLSAENQGTRGRLVLGGMVRSDVERHRSAQRPDWSRVFLQRRLPTPLQTPRVDAREQVQVGQTRRP